MGLAALASFGTARAGAEVTASASVAPAAVTWPGVQELTFRLELATGERAERFAVSMEPSYYGLPATEPYELEGSPLGPQASVEKEGALVLGLGGAPLALPVCAPSFNRYHGYEPSTFKIDVDMPARSSGALIARRPFGDFAPWPDSDLRLAFRITPDLVGLGEGTVAERVVYPPQPRRTGATGVRIRFSTRPFVPRGPTRAEIAPGVPIAIEGSTDPPLPGARISLRYLGPENDSDLRTLARPEVDDRGRFAVAGWRPRAAGRYELWAFYRADRAGVVDDHACPRPFRTTGRYEPPRDRTGVRVRSGAARLTAQGKAPLRVSCVDDDDCRTTLTLRAGHATLARRRISLGAGLAQAEYVPIPRAWRAELDERGRLVVVASAPGTARRVVLRPPRRTARARRSTRASRTTATSPSTASIPVTPPGRGGST